MKKIFFSTFLIFAACSTAPKSTDNSVSKTNDIADNREPATYENIRASLKLLFNDTLKRTKQFFFSNNVIEDTFLLTINPGSVKDSKSKIEIISHDGKHLYSETFYTYYFVMYLIHNADTIPTLDAQTEYFKNNIKDFFESFRFITTRKDLNDWTESFGSDWAAESDKKFLSEIRADSSIILLDIACFNCEEGGYLIGYSKEQGKVVTLLSHD